MRYRGLDWYHVCEWGLVIPPRMNQKGDQTLDLERNVGLLSQHATVGTAFRRKGVAVQHSPFRLPYQRAAKRTRAPRCRRLR